ncbi:MAG TPA: type III-B CRISPR module RAMP protein Cmr6 [Micromonosporaceae bacterium]
MAETHEMRIAGPLSQILAVVDKELRPLPVADDAEHHSLTTANALMILNRCAIVAPDSGLDDVPIRSWAVRTSLGQDRQLLEAAAQRRVAALASLKRFRLGVAYLRLTMESALLTGSAQDGVRDVGIALHGTYGWPVLPGSTLKGTTREYARQCTEHDGGSYDALFGVAAPEARVGSVMFLDAMPSRTGVRITEHVLTPHSGPYYRDETHNTPPAEYHNPVPIPFLAVEGGSFVIALVGESEAVNTAARLLKEAVAELGVGAKTAAGYGYLQVMKAGQ